MKKRNLLKKTDIKKNYIIILIAFLLDFALLVCGFIYGKINNPNGFIFTDLTLRVVLVITIFALLIVLIIFVIYLIKGPYKITSKPLDVKFEKVEKEKTIIHDDTFLFERLRSNEQNFLDTTGIYDYSNDLDKDNDTIDNNSRFYMLTHIDNMMTKYSEPIYNNKISLKEICQNFRNYASYKLHLYYDIKDIRRFISSLSVTKLILLQGMSGTGKTSLAYAFGTYLQNKTVVIPIQPMWKERTDLIGYYNEFTKKFNETTLLYKMYEACYTKEIYITVLDEMNIARVEYYFAEFLSLFELPNPNSRILDVVSDVWENDPKLLHEGKLRLPINMWFIGTANNDDSTFAISDKVYDRAMVLNLDKKAMVFEGKPTKEDKISVDHLYSLFYKAQNKNKLSARNERRLRELDKYLIETFRITFGNRIMKQIEAYTPVVVECGGSELDALDDIISRKILRKLESKNPVYVRSQSEGLINKIEDLFGEDALPLSIDYIKHIENS